MWRSTAVAAALGLVLVAPGQAVPKQVTLRLNLKAGDRVLYRLDRHIIAKGERQNTDIESQITSMITCVHRTTSRLRLSYRVLNVTFPAASPKDSLFKGLEDRIKKTDHEDELDLRGRVISTSNRLAEASSAWGEQQVIFPVGPLHVGSTWKQTATVPAEVRSGVRLASQRLTAAFRVTKISRGQGGHILVSIERRADNTVSRLSALKGAKKLTIRASSEGTMVVDVTDGLLERFMDAQTENVVPRGANSATVTTSLLTRIPITRGK